MPGIAVCNKMIIIKVVKKEGMKYGLQTDC
jgi:hypothetical protein